MGKIQVGAKSPKTVDMGGFTVLPDVVTADLTNGVSAEEEERLKEGHWNYADDNAGKSAGEMDDVSIEAHSGGDKSSEDETKVGIETPAEESPKKKNKKA